MKILLIIAFTLLAPAVWARDCFVYFGTYTDRSSKGIYVSRLDMDTGKLSLPELAAAIASPNYLAISPDGRFLFASIQVGKSTNGVVAAFARDGRTGSLKLLDEKPAGDVEPCYVGLDAAGRNVFIANYPGGSVKSFHLHPDGTLADGTFLQHSGKRINPSRQTAPHAHCFVGAPAGPFALACDLGIDKVMIYRVNPDTAALMPMTRPLSTLAPGSGPRHLAFSPDGKTVCVISEMACTVTVFDWDGVKGDPPSASKPSRSSRRVCIETLLRGGNCLPPGWPICLRDGARAACPRGQYHFRLRRGCQDRQSFSSKIFSVTETFPAAWALTPPAIG